MSGEDQKTADSDGETTGGSREKICKVCGDKALGYNFNAITCESCKAFFRRNALKNKEFKCPFNKKCEITPITRRFCQLCRLIKCFEIGMRKEHIMTEDDKMEKRKKIEKNRAKKRQTDDSADFTTKTPRMKEEEREEVVDPVVGGADEGIKMRAPVQINSLNMASTSKKTYQKKQLSYSSSAEQLVPFPSPGVPEPSESVSVTESRTCNVFNQFDSSQSRSLEIYQISKSFDERKLSRDDYNKDCEDSSLMKIILDSEFSKSVAYASPTLNQQPTEKVCNYKDRLETDGEEDYVISEKNLLELAKNNKNIVVETTEDGTKIFDIQKGFPKNGGSLQYNPHHLEESSCSKDGSSPLLTSLINSSKSSDGSPAKSSSFKVNVAEEVFEDIPRKSELCLTSSIDSILSEAIKLEYEAYTSMNPRMNSRELNDAERAKLNELIVANKALLAPLEDDITGDEFGFNAITGSGRSMLVDVLNLTAVAIRRLIKMSKKINAFKNMCQDDQIALLKGGCTEMMILRSAMTYDPDRDSWKIPQSKEKLMNIKVDVLKEAGGKIFEEHQRFLQTFDQKWRNDENIMLILSAIALFTPDRPRVVHFDVIKLEQNSYYYLLRRYLESVYQGCDARLTFLKLIHKISELHKLNEDHVRVYLDANPKEIEPLLIEIFDLKPH